jgi:hypothetical protein
MLRRQFSFAALAAVVLIGTSLSRPVRADEFDDRRDHHREHCEALELEDRELRERIEHTPDPYDRERLGHRLHEIADEREHDCRANEVDDRWEHHREHCEALEHEEHELRERVEHTLDPVERERLGFRLHEIAEDRDHQCRRD